MSAARKSAVPKILDLPLAIAAGLTFGFYWFVTQESMRDSLLNRYTTEHTVEYVIVGFFIWGIVDVVTRALGFPREMLALRQDWLPRRTGREPIAHATELVRQLQKKPQWLLQSRLGERLTAALTYLQEKGSADEFGDYLRFLGDQDEARTHANFGLIRFITWVTPMLGFLGTVVHFGTALGGHTAGDIGEKLPTVVAEMGTAFNTTTVALIAATSMMFCLFLCERTEREIVHAVDRRVERELLHRFVMADASLAPFLGALEAASQANLKAMDATIERQLEIWTKQQQWQAQLWVESLEKLQERFETNDADREKRLVRVIEAMEQQRKENRSQLKESVEQVSAVKTDFAKLIESLSGIAQGESELIKVQTTLAENLRLLRETQQIDHALHGLTAAIHLLTARHQPSAARENRAA
jgi:biopolymer transport protein ExbB/TolQ